MKILPRAILVLSLLSPSRGALATVKDALRPGDTVARCVEADPAAGHRFKPHCEETIVRAGVRSEMRYNAHGLRDKDYSPKPAPGWKRILLVGSSRMVGPGLPESETPPRVLERYLRRSTKKIEVINASVEGYSPLNQLARLGEWIQAYSPTHVVLQVEFQPALNSDMMLSPYLERVNGAPGVRMRVLPWMKPVALVMGATPANFERYRKVITWQSAAYRAWRTRYCRFFHKDLAELAGCLLETSIGAVQAMQKAAEDAHAKFVLVTSDGSFTNEMHISPAFDLGAAEFWDAYTPKLEVDAFDLKKTLRAHRLPLIAVAPITGEDFVLPGDYHFNKLGADLFARSLAVRLQDFLF
jgi:hypothetical protein